MLIDKLQKRLDILSQMQSHAQIIRLSAVAIELGGSGNRHKQFILAVFTR